MGDQTQRASETQSDREQIISAGIRTIQETGGSATISLPRRDIQNLLGIDVEEELIGSCLRYQLCDSGRLIIEIEPGSQRASD